MVSGGRRERRLDPLDFIVSRPGVDWWVAGLLVGFHLYLIDKYPVADLLLTTGQDRRVRAYTATAGVSSVVAGFAALAMGQYKGAAGTRMTLVKQRVGHTLRSGLRSILTTPLLVAGTCIVCIVLDIVPRDPSGVRFVFEAAFALGAVRFARMIYMFSNLVDITDLDDTEVPKVPKAVVAFRAHQESA